MKFHGLDIFAGCGGLSEGFRQAGFDIAAQIEMDKWACETLKLRHFYYELKKINREYHYKKFLQGETCLKDLETAFPEINSLISNIVIQAEFGKESIDEISKKIETAKKYKNIQQVQVVIGGPPCQAYSLVGRARDPKKMESDSRNFLYEYYLNILEIVQPEFFVFENVPGLITAEAKGQEIFTKMINDFKQLIPPYEIAPSFDEFSKNPKEYLLDSNNFGVPQKRKRVIFVGYKRSLLQRRPEIKDIFRNILKPSKLTYAGSTVGDAISDLPHIKPGEGNDHWFGKYTKNTRTLYQRKMRKNSPGLVNFKARTHMETDLERYRFFIEHHKNGNGAATLRDLEDQKPHLLPNHKNLDEFIDRFKVQWWSQTASTITSHICKDGHYYIHPNLRQCRSFTVREAARCQSFPDNYFFAGPRTEQFRQVGNAVPPMMARVIAKHILEELEAIK